MSDAKGVALLVGLNSVNPVNYEGWDGKLQVCETDADDMNQLATSQGFSTTVLKTEEATRQAVIDEIRGAADALSDNDIFFLYYSGHGAWIKDMEGDEEDRRDETWCLYDNEIIDDELRYLWSRFGEGVRVLVILDSCHSGTGTKGRLGRPYPHSRPVSPSGPLLGPTGKKYGKKMPRKFLMENLMNKNSFYNKIRASLPKEFPPICASVRLISGCRDRETSLVFEDWRNSLFTSQLLHVWNQGLFDGDYADFHNAIKNRIFELQEPNHYLIGVQDQAYDAQKPFTV